MKSGKSIVKLANWIYSTGKREREFGMLGIHKDFVEGSF